MTAKELHSNQIQDLIQDEVEAIEGYDKAIEESDNPEAIEVYEHIKNEEVEHIAELEGLDKMKAEDITSEQAWQDFKSGYSDFEEQHVEKDRDGDQASLPQKIDLMNAKLMELSTDVSRLNDSIPQALGTIEEGKALEEEAKEELEGAESPEGDIFGGEDDGLDDYFSDDEESDEESDGEFEDLEAEDMDEGDQITESDEDSEEADMEEESDMDESEMGEEAESEESDEDYISLDELDDSEEEEAEEEQDEILEKMVQVLKKMDMRLSRLERENAGLKKQLSKGMTVQATPVRAEQRQNPGKLRLIKGSYNRPPVSTQYVANQRDIGVGVKKSEGSGNHSVFSQELNEVFAECNRIANQTR